VLGGAKGERLYGHGRLSSAGSHEARFVAEKKINYTILLGDDHICKVYGVEAMPVTLLIDRQGRIAASHEGVVEKGAGESEIKILLQESTKGVAK